MIYVRRSLANKSKEEGVRIFVLYSAEHNRNFLTPSLDSDVRAHSMPEPRVAPFCLQWVSACFFSHSFLIFYQITCSHHFQRLLGCFAYSLIFILQELGDSLCVLFVPHPA
jgi:hypothetical protein